MTIFIPFFVQQKGFHKKLPVFLARSTNREYNVCNITSRPLFISPPRTGSLSPYGHEINIHVIDVHWYLADCLCCVGVEEDLLLAAHCPYLPSRR